MALYYNLVFGLLVVEMVLFAILSLPLPSKIRKPVLTSISKPFQLKEFNIALKCILVFILILFVDSVNRVSNIDDQLSGFAQSSGTAAGSAYVTDRSDLQARKFYAQRNLYLTGFTLFLTLIVSRTYNLVAELLTLKDEVRLNPDILSQNEEYVKLKAELDEKNEKIEILKQQADGLRKDYDQISEELTKKEKSTTDKKTD